MTAAKERGCGNPSCVEHGVDKHGPAFDAAREPLPTEPDPRLVHYVDLGGPGPVATNIFCAACVALSLVAVGWIIWTVAR